jgi:hypothetical protein
MFTRRSVALPVIAGINVVVIAFGTAGARSGFPGLQIGKSMAFLSFSVAAIGIITFFGLLGTSLNSSSQITERGLRTSIAIAIVTVYLVIVGVSAFFTQKINLNPITEQMLTSFTTVVGIVVAFFFGASAYVEAKTVTSEAPKQE